jgi:uncharacterized membrane protein YidH (DUF202 family)
LANDVALPNRSLTLLNDERLTQNSEARLLFPIGGGKWEEIAMKTTILAYVIALGGVAMIVFGLWGHYILIRERASELRLRDYIPTIQTIAVGLVLIGVARGLQVLLWIFATTSRLSVFPSVTS